MILRWWLLLRVRGVFPLPVVLRGVVRIRVWRRGRVAIARIPGVIRRGCGQLGLVGRLGRWLARGDTDQFTLEYWWFSCEPIEDEL